jgi:hypothetical protein
VFARISLEVGDELVQRVLHVHMPDFDPDLVLVRQHGFLFFLLPLLVDERMPAKSVARSAIAAETTVKEPGGAPIALALFDR